MTRYADSGFVVSLYKSELTSESAGRVMAEGCMPVLLSQLNCLEVQNALHLAVFRGKITHAERLAKRGFFQADVQAGVFSIVPVPSVELHDLAGELADRYSAVEGTRNLDLLHVAAALLLKVGELLSFETRQRKVASKEGLRVQPSTASRLIAHLREQGLLPARGGASGWMRSLPFAPPDCFHQQRTQTPAMPKRIGTQNLPPGIYRGAMSD